MIAHSLEQHRSLRIPVTTRSYHALIYGWLADELIWCVDPKKRTVGQFIQDEIANKLGIEFHAGLPLQDYRVSALTFDLESLRT